MVKSKRDEIIEKYEDLRTVICSKFGVEVSTILPDLQIIDITDLLFYFTVTFSDGNYREVVVNMLKYVNYQLDDKKVDELVEIVGPFFNWLSQYK